MKRYLLPVFVLLSLPTFSEGFAHSGHKHKKVVVTEKKAKAKARVSVVRLVEQGKLSKGWKESKLVSSEKIKNKKGGEDWMMKFKNSMPQGKEKTILYVFLNKWGQYLAANFTGK